SKAAWRRRRAKIRSWLEKTPGRPKVALNGGHLDKALALQDTDNKDSGTRQGGEREKPEMSLGCRFVQAGSFQKKGPTPLQCRPPNNQTNQPLTLNAKLSGKTKNPPSLVQGL